MVRESHVPLLVDRWFYGGTGGDVHVGAVTDVKVPRKGTRDSAES